MKFCRVAMLGALFVGMTGVSSMALAAKQAGVLVQTCVDCSSSGTVADSTLQEILNRPDVGVGTVYKIVDGDRNESITYQATAVDRLEYVKQPYKTWISGSPGGGGIQPRSTVNHSKFLVMHRVSDTTQSGLQTALVEFYKAAPVGWIKRYLADTNNDAMSEQSKMELANTELGAYAKQHALGPFASSMPSSWLTFPDSNANAYKAMLGGAVQNAVLDWANHSIYARISVVMNSLRNVSLAMAGANSMVSPSSLGVTVTIYFKDRSSLRLIADASTPTGEFAVDTTYGSARDSNNNSIPYNSQQVGGAPGSGGAIYDFTGDPQDLASFMGRMQLWGINVTSGPRLACVSDRGGRPSCILIR